MSNADFGKVAFSCGHIGGHRAVFADFRTVDCNGCLRVTREYSLAYIPEADEWTGDVIEFGQWRNLEKDEIADLLMSRQIDEIVAKRVDP